MDVRLTGYDDYVKEFEEIRKNPDVQPWSEDEILENEEIIMEHSQGHYLEAEDTKDGQAHVFLWDFQFPDPHGDNQPYIYYVGASLA